jgi:hypothetical protein
MATLVNALDKHISQQIGENGHVEYGWSNNIQEKIVQFYFQISRTDENGMDTLKNILDSLLTNLKHQLFFGTLLEKQIAKGYLTLLYKMIGQTRDIINGKGEYKLTYMMIYKWYDFFPDLAIFAVNCLVNIENKKNHPYGSWKDIKYLCKFCTTHGATMDHPLIQESIKIINKQLKIDNNCFPSEISLAAKWVPREKSSFKYLYQSLATDYFKEYMKTANSQIKSEKAILKCKTEYRKLISGLNKRIDTLQVKQCGNVWSEIDFKNVTSISLLKQKKAFLNVCKNGNIRYSDSLDRVNCAEHFNEHVKKAIQGDVEIKGKRVELANFVKQARSLYKNSISSQVEKDLLNLQWINNASQNNALENFVPVVDLSSSMDGDPMDVAIAMGIRIAEKSKLGKRIMTFSIHPRWIKLDNCNDFISQVKEIENGDIGYNTDFHKVLNLFLDTIISNKMPPEDVQDMVIVLLSDMQIDEAEGINNKDHRYGSQKRETLYEEIKCKYAEAGIRVHGKPYKPPHILFWNLRNTNGFPSLSNEKNVSMMSGFNPVLLNQFCDKGIAALESSTPWSVLEQILSNERYKIMGDYLENNFHLF